MTDTFDDLDASCFNMVEFINRQVLYAHAVRLDAQIIFGDESLDWTHDERCERLGEFWNGRWRDLGGEGPHPHASLRGYGTAGG